MKFLDRFERLVERSVEGGLGRILPRSLQPVQIAKAAARAMDDGRVVGVRGPEVPNLYHVRLAPADLARFGEFRGTLAANTAAYLAEYARQRGLRPVSPPSVELVEDRSVPAGSVRVDARFRDRSGSVPRSTPGSVSESSGAPPVVAISPVLPVTDPSAPSNASAPARLGPAWGPERAEGDAAAASQPQAGPTWTETNAAQSAEPAAATWATAGPSPAPADTGAPAAASAPAGLGSQEHPAGAAASPPSGSPAEGPATPLDERGWLVDRAGQRYPLRGREVVRLGRAADNDVILDADTVSRHHAQLRWQAGHWFAYDLGSTNGTTVAGAPLGAEPILLPPGATLRLGDRALTFVTS